MKNILKKLKTILIMILGISNYKTITTFLYRLFNNYHRKIWIAINNKDYVQISEKKRNIYFGYYDHSSERDNKILYISTIDNLKESADIFYYDLVLNKKVKIGCTNAWNYQMGARLRWLDDDIVIVNDYTENVGYFSKTINLDGKVKNIYKFPIYDLSRDKKYSFYLDFSILNYFRPGYGYSNINEQITKDRILNNGIYRGDLNTNTKELILSISEIIEYNNENVDQTNLHYINHISCSRFDDIIIFFHLWIDEKKQLKNRVFIINYFGKILSVLDDFEKASHYSFKSKDELLLTVVSNKKIEYRLYDIRKKTYKLFEFLTVDGHPSYIKDDLFITDTYPDHNGMQHIYICDYYGIKKELVQIYHNPRKHDELRCDLHPRYLNGKLTFDSISGKYRKENILKLDLNNLDIEQISEIPISDEKRIYLNLFHKVDINIFKLWYKKFFDFSYQAHILVNKLLKTKSKFMREIYYNKLQKNYSLWISPKCKIGKNIHFMHLDGITIGSGVEIGNNCVIYQQVTIGKEKDSFPIIGNNVTIYAGAKIIGGVKIGDNSVIGANAVVIRDVPENSTEVGVPARIIKDSRSY